MRQRLGIAQALIGRPQVLLLDEPASALDPVGRRQVLELMAGLRAHATIFYSTHILDDVQRVSDHVAILDKGRLVLSAPTQDLLSSFTHDRVRVVVRRRHDSHRGGLAGLPGVMSATAATGAATRPRSCSRRARAPDAVQRAVTRYAVETDLTLVRTRPTGSSSKTSSFASSTPRSVSHDRRDNRSTAANANGLRRGCWAWATSCARTSASGSTAAGHGWSSSSRAPSSRSPRPTPASRTGIWPLPADAGEVRQGPPAGPDDNVLSPLATQFLVLVAIFATISLFLAERDGGTLAWTISKPVSRPSVLLSKWLSPTGVLWVAAVFVPLAVTTTLW